MKIIPSNKFINQFEKLLKKNIRYRNKINKTLKLLKLDIDHPSLRLHKLSGFGYDAYSISVDMSIRIIFSIEDDSIYLLKIGNHDEVY